MVFCFLIHRFNRKIITFILKKCLSIKFVDEHFFGSFYDNGRTFKQPHLSMTRPNPMKMMMYGTRGNWLVAW